jgi:hypothetical protein
MFSRWIVTNITSARGTLHCRKTRILCGDQLVVCGLYFYLLKLVVSILQFAAATRTATGPTAEQLAVRKLHSQALNKFFDCS